MKPWEKYQPTEADTGAPWEKYGKPKPTMELEKPGFLVGIGKGMADAVRGVTDLVGNNDPSLPFIGKLGDSSAADAEIAKSHSAQLGEEAGNILSAIPSAFIPGANTILGSAAIGAGMGALYNKGDIEERAKHAVNGAAGGLAGGVLGKAIPYVWNMGKTALKPFSGQKGQEEIISNVLNEVSGSDSGKVLAKLLKEGEIIPGSQPTAAEMANNGGIAAVQRWAEQANPADYAFRRQANADARTAALRGIAGTDAELEAAKTARDAASNNLYKQADNKEVELDALVKEILKRPSMQQATARAQKLANERGEGLVVGKDIPASELNTGILDAKGNPILINNDAVPATATGKGLHYIKMGVDDILNRHEQAGIGAHELGAIGSTKNALLDWVDKAIPEYGQARTAYAENSKPINQMEVGQTLLNKANSALSNYGTMTRENAETFARALRDANKTAATATGYRGAKLKDIMTPEQMQTLGNVARDLSRRANADSLGRGAGSNTFQNLSMNQLAESAGIPTWLKIGASYIPGSRMVSGIVKAGYDGADKRMQQKLAEILMNPQETARVMSIAQNAPPRLPMRSEYQAAPGIMGALIAEALQK